MSGRKTGTEIDPSAPADGQRITRRDLWLGSTSLVAAPAFASRSLPQAASAATTNDTVSADAANNTRRSGR
jgi:hypothetical protein